MRTTRLVLTIYLAAALLVTGCENGGYPALPTPTGQLGGSSPVTQDAVATSTSPLFSTTPTPGLLPSFTAIQAVRASQPYREFEKYCDSLGGFRVEGWQGGVVYISDGPEDEYYSLAISLGLPESIQGWHEGDVYLFFTHGEERPWQIGERIVFSGTVSTVDPHDGSVNMLNPQVRLVVPVER